LFGFHGSHFVLIPPAPVCFTLHFHLFLRAFLPFRTCLPACGEVKLIRGWTYLNCNCNSKEYEAELVDWKGALAGG
jgi:hypothetical protein